MLSIDVDPIVHVRVRPEPVPPEYRIVWTGTVLLIGLQACSRAGRSSIARLHLIFWALSSEQIASAVAESAQSGTGHFPLHVPYYPLVDRAIEYLRAEGAVSIDEGAVQIQGKGRKLVEQAALYHLLEQTRTSAAILGKHVTEFFFKQLSGRP